MAYTTGNANNYKHLLSIMDTFAAANGWVVMEQSDEQVFLKGTGLAGLDEIYVGVATYEEPLNGRFNWNMVGSWGYRAGRSFTNHPRSSNYRGLAAYEQVVAYLSNNQMTYWMVCNPRRIIVVVKVGTTYQHIHLGLLTVPATDAQYPYPLFIGGGGYLLSLNTSGLLNAYWSESSSTIGARLSWPGGQWATKTASQASGDNPPPFTVTSFLARHRDALLTGLDGTYYLEPFYVTAVSQRGIMGTFEGLFRVTGYGNSAENIITVDGVNYMVFPDGSKSAPGDYCALRMN